MSNAYCVMRNSFKRVNYAVRITKETSMFQIETGRLRLLPCSVRAAQTATANRSELEAELGVRVPDDWPGEDLRDFLPAYAKLVGEDAARAGWGIWLMLQPGEQSLVGDIGLKGPPDGAGTVEIGYSVLPAFRGHGYATEAARALVAWAAAQPGVRRVTAECLEDNLASIRVLEKAGMHCYGREGDALKWEL
jgi:ribosomal-protein-alanine N-acetyltransferase